MAKQVFLPLPREAESIQKPSIFEQKGKFPY